MDNEKEKLYGKLAFLFKHRNSKEFPELIKKMEEDLEDSNYKYYKEGVDQDFEYDWGLPSLIAEESVMLSAALSGKRYEEDFKEFCSRGISSWTDFFHYINFLQQKFDMKFELPKPKTTILLDCQEADDFLRKMRKGDGRIKDVFEDAEISVKQEGKEFLFLFDIGYCYSFKDKKEIMKEVRRILREHKDIFIPIIKAELQEIKEATKIVDSNITYHAFTYGKFLSELASSLGISINNHFSKQIDYVVKENNLSVGKGPSHLIRLEDSIVEKRDPLSESIEIRQEKETLAKIVYGITFSGKNSFDDENPQFTSLEDKLTQQQFSVIKPALLKVLTDILQGRRNDLPFHLSDKQIISWLDQFVNYDKSRQLRETVDFAKRNKAMDVTTFMSRIIEEINSKKWKTKEESCLGCPEKYQAFLAVFENPMYASMVHEHIMDYEREHSAGKIKERKDEIEKKKLEVSRLLREHEDALKKAISSLDSEKKERFFILNRKYPLQEYEKAWQRSKQEGARWEVVSGRIWQGVPFYAVKRYSKKLHDICKQVSPAIISYRISPGQKIIEEKEIVKGG